MTLHAVQNPAHRRSVLVEPTAEGRAAFGAVHAHELAALADLAITCTDEDLRTAARVLAALDHDIRGRARATASPAGDGR